MPKYLSFLNLCVLAISTHAQSEHVKFMGIPINGTINQFQKEIERKGWIYNENESVKSSGSRIFNGMFANEEAELYVLFENQTYTVYQVAILINAESKENAIIKYNKLKDLYNRKYPEYKKDEYAIDNTEALEITITNRRDNSDLGTITMFIGKTYERTNNMQEIKYHLNINYVDSYNEQIETNILLDDL